MAGWRNKSWRKWKGEFMSEQASKIISGAWVAEEVSEPVVG